MLRVGGVYEAILIIQGLCCASSEARSIAWGLTDSSGEAESGEGEPRERTVDAIVVVAELGTGAGFHWDAVFVLSLQDLQLYFERQRSRRGRGG